MRLYYINPNGKAKENDVFSLFSRVQSYQSTIVKDAS
jgi:hypothetical protein